MDGRRTVVYEEKFENELKQIQPDLARADELLAGVEWVLAKEPQQGYRISQSVWAYPIDATDHFPALIIYYTFSDEKVFFLSIKMTARNGTH